MTNSVISFNDAPKDILALIAKEVGNPSSFSLVCKDFQKAQLAAFRLLKNDYRASELLQTIAADLLQPSSPEDESSDAFNRQLVKDVYLKIIGQAREAPLGEMIIESTLKNFPRVLSVRRLEMIIRIINSKNESPICSMSAPTYYVSGGSWPPRDPFPPYLDEKHFAIRDMQKDMDKILGQYKQPKIDPRFFQLIQRKLHEKESISFNPTNLRSLDVALFKNTLPSSDREAYIQRMVMELSEKELKLPEPSYTSAIWDNCKSVTQSFLKKLPFFN